ncbi:response regulator transcription factor [Clostridium luticellarii]|uniref:Stage 0 sporulation protein A homolog n=1 Tax=Clostridium luticellarii TaxID=1691940 RepID=A0A2T0BM32_9CLOT|nr:response regulator transcription factor [Clostridium luticellarii]MCI1944125.1 response regulator transcription factor [Clostridium luticellarii]MCI1967233.1 response regulator transcription factor [Clostridium luticellarii]MCI1995144.1 response regulator transcription factor [Clostridium luticellarii]MCI2039360.1 response regulator transcription factor [Clostridium luticellarii]PRR84928.1 Response regulator ArlR [Clostridium luticellarii]
MSGKKILIIEDEVKIARFIQLELQHEGYEVKKCQDGREGLKAALEGDCDLVILDVMLPSINGMEVLRRLRRTSQVPVIMLTAKDEVTDKVMALDIGAEDYVTKPFAIEELLARIRVIFKYKSQLAERGIISAGKLKMDMDRHIVTFQDDIIDLTKKEFDLLEYLMVNKNIVLSRDNILINVWKYDYAGDTNIVDVYIRYLRSKIDDRYNKKFIYTVRGVGYQLKYE